MVTLRKALDEEIPHFVAMEKSGEVSEYIIPYDPEQHREEMQKPDIVYLSIMEGDSLSGFFILAIDAASVEFRRIVVSARGRGVGQAAIVEMEKYCRTELRCNRIWLDVFAANKRGRHIYEKLGYQHFKSGEHGGKPLLYYEKLF